MGASTSAAPIDETRYYPNCYIGEENLVRPPEAFKEKIQENTKQLLSLLQTEISKGCLNSGDFSVYTGSSGIALLYWHLARLWKVPKFADEAINLIGSSISQLKQKKFSFLGGDAGPLALLAVLYHDLGDNTKRDQAIEKLLLLADRVCDEQSDPNASNELLFGRAGYLYALHFVNNHTKGTSSEKLIDRNLIQKVANLIILEGQRAKKPYLYYEWHEKCYLGAGHGILGIIQILLMDPDLLSDVERSWIKKTLDMLLTVRFPSGNMPSSYESRNNDRLVHWCHGASGAIWTWFLAHYIFKDEKYFAAAKECAAVIWERGLLRKGYSICHGVGSSAYGLMAAYIYTQDTKYLEQAFLFAHWCFTYGTKCEHIPDRPLSLFEGLAGVVYMLADFGWNDSPGFPAFCCETN